jgi:hypothetical protein
LEVLELHAFRADGSEVEIRRGNTGRVVIITDEPLLELGRKGGDYKLWLYGIIGRTYQLETTPSLVQQFAPGQSLRMLDLTQELPLSPINPVQFYRGRESNP